MSGAALETRGTNFHGRLEVLERRPDGTSRVRLPLAVETYGMRDSFGLEDLSREVLADLERNLPSDHGAVGVYWRHPNPDAPGEQRGPRIGRIASARAQDGVLIGELDLDAEATRAVVEERGFHSFSIDAARDARGWKLTGGIFTNSPRLPFTFAASADGDRNRATRWIRDWAKGLPEDLVFPVGDKLGELVAIARDQVARGVHPTIEEALANAHPSEVERAWRQITERGDKAMATKRGFEDKALSLAAEKGISLSDAVDAVRQQYPELARDAAADYRAEAHLRADRARFAVEGGPGASVVFDMPDGTVVTLEEKRAAESELSKLATALAAENGIPFHQALDRIRRDHPATFKTATADCRGTARASKASPAGEDQSAAKRVFASAYHRISTGQADNLGAALEQVRQFESVLWGQYVAEARR